MCVKVIKKTLIFWSVLLVLTGLVYAGLIFLTAAPHTENQQTSSSAQKVVKKQQLKLVAVGDSLTQGVGDPTATGGYVSLIKQKLQAKQNIQVSTQNFGKAGDRSDQILARLEQQKKMQQQLRRADVIVMTVGGNDLMQVLQRNFSLLTSDQLASALPSAEKTYTQKISQLLTKIRSYNQQAPIFLFSVYNPFYVYFPTLTKLQQYTTEWNKVTVATAAQQSRVYPINIEKKLSEGQYLGKTQQLKKTTLTDLNTVNTTRLDKILQNQKEKNNYLSAADHFHPNLRGYMYMTDQLYTTMLKHKATWLNKEGAK
ncbi:SGNH/GDSL hydrolase family protein [Liquorilactobacillus satsumensis]|uniref:SGNH/GDSL hydrolase family protein n=1 Tax=Liquorilactobacillus satsumensis TaxID=259059 RepID=UPI0036F403C4|nr:SGNH/GDSL hydrolase family protein [Liquorilactobacillus satsumensis]